VAGSAGGGCCAAAAPAGSRFRGLLCRSGHPEGEQHCGAGGKEACASAYLILDAIPPPADARVTHGSKVAQGSRVAQGATAIAPDERRRTAGPPRHRCARVSSMT
jgi:hypothetical protein